MAADVGMLSSGYERSNENQYLGVLDEDNSDKILTKYLFETQSYDKTMRPAIQQLSPKYLRASFFLISVNKLGELQEKPVMVTSPYE